eukprot:626573-Rhodomonas_salina.3
MDRMPTYWWPPSIMCFSIFKNKPPWSQAALQVPRWHVHQLRTPSAHAPASILGASSLLARIYSHWLLPPIHAHLQRPLTKLTLAAPSYLHTHTGPICTLLQTHTPGWQLPPMCAHTLAAAARKTLPRPLLSRWLRRRDAPSSPARRGAEFQSTWNAPPQPRTGPDNTEAECPAWPSAPTAPHEAGCCRHGTSESE